MFFCLQRMLGHIHALQQICLVQLVQPDHCKFQVRDDQYTCNVLAIFGQKVIGIVLLNSCSAYLFLILRL